MDDVFISNSPSPESDKSPKPSCNENTVHLKLLIPSGAAGAIIGKDGKAITSIQQQTSTKVKVSKQNEFFPGTTERVCLVTGSITGVLQVHQHIAKQIIDKKDLVNGPNLMQQRQANFPFQNPPSFLAGGIANVDRTRQVKVLVPNSTAGMIIGKGGNYIRQLQQSTGATIQISQRSSTPQSTGERCVTITGDPEACQSALEEVIGKLADDPQASNLATFTNISYNGISPLSNSPINPSTLHPSSGLVGRNTGTAGPPIMPLMSPASIPNFLLPALWNPSLLPYILPRTLHTDGRNVSDFSQSNNNATLSNNSYHAHLSLPPNATINSNSSYNQSGLLATPSANAAMLNSHLQQLWGSTPLSSVAGAAAANSGATGTSVTSAAGSGGSLTGSGSLINHVDGSCAMKELLVPDTFIPVLSENLNILQTDCGVAITVHPPYTKPMGSQLPMKLCGTTSGALHRHEPERWRLVSVVGSPSALFRSVDRIQALQQQQQTQHSQQKSSSSVSFSMPPAVGLSSKAPSVVKTVPTTLSAI